MVNKALYIVILRSTVVGKPYREVV